MATTYWFRVLLGIRAADQASYNAWWQANMPGGDAPFVVPVSATGAAPAQGYVLCCALELAGLRILIIRLCQLAGVAFPADWDTYTRAEKRDWVRSQIPALLSGANLQGMVMDDNDAAWSSYEQYIIGRGFRVIRTRP